MTEYQFRPEREQARRQKEAIERMIVPFDEQMRMGNETQALSEAFQNLRGAQLARFMEFFGIASPQLSIGRVRYAMRILYGGICSANAFDPIIPEKPPAVGEQPPSSALREENTGKRKGKYIGYHKPHPLGPDFDHWDW